METQNPANEPQRPQLSTEPSTAIEPKSLETQTPLENYEYYNKRLQEELDQLQTDLKTIRRLAFESLLAFIKEIAIKIGLSTQGFIDMFGPLFHDTLPEADKKENE